MDRRNEDTALLALRGGLRGRFRRSFDSMENAFDILVLRRKRKWLEKESDITENSRS